ncbi:MAG TPA: 2-C-methyl-D-erythritol 4-phosphate cytidylyltransferase [Acidimicrobiales bacterium]|nr:2-C-methyl-D-erythritol 4-phosphate cytidylyltransferase [Acidimicrobiales bacterium]
MSAPPPAPPGAGTGPGGASDAAPAPVWAVVVAAGGGTRFGGPKQYAPLGDRRVVDWSLGAARAATDGVVLVVPPDRAATAEPGADVVVAGGATRSASVRAGLAAVPAEAEVVVVHDGARPLAGPSLYGAVVAAVRDGADAAVPGVALVDSVRRRDGGAVDRDELVAVQTPQAFAAAALRAAHASGGEASDDATLVERAGGKVVVVPGDPANLKVTHPADVDVAARHLGLVP